jgi:hypothetical protein
MTNGVNQLRQHQDDQDRHQERRDIEAWLTSTDYSSKQREFIATRQEATGEWLLTSEEFQKWLATNNSTLYCPGIPGSGKTIMSAVVVNHLLKSYRDEPSIGIAYVYCNYSQKQEQTLENILSLLLMQLLQRQLSVPATVQQLYKSHLADRSYPTVDELKKALQSMLQLHSRVIIIIDALDECSKEGCDSLLSVLFNLQNQENGHLNLFATSRFVPEITSQFARFPQREIRAEEEDILRYIDARMPRLLRSRISKYPDLQESIRMAVSKATSGMYVKFQYTYTLVVLLTLSQVSPCSAAHGCPFEQVNAWRHQTFSSELASRNARFRYNVRTSDSKNRIPRGRLPIASKTGPIVDHSHGKATNYRGTPARSCNQAWHGGTRRRLLT